ncbi:MAG: hypothetical protein HY298_23055 [Verrucomicrobia bacterium]|nr:hypothetical protein [Verrucomicrobiota bacterium]
MKNLKDFQKHKPQTSRSSRRSLVERVESSLLWAMQSVTSRNGRRQFSADHGLERWPYRARALCLIFVQAAFCLRAASQSYSIDWFTIDGGGGTSTGSVYSVSGTIGQPDAGPTMSGGNYSVDGGFWSILATVQTPGAPLLTITRSNATNVVLSWPWPSTGFVLQENPVIGTTNWTNVGTSPITNGPNLEVIISPPIGNRFYRLKHP